MCSSIGSSLMTTLERLLQREHMEISSSFVSLPQRLLQEQRTTILKCLAILPAIDPVNNMIVLHVRYSIPERFVTFQSILNHYKKEVQGKEIGGGTKWRQYLIATEKEKFY